MVFFVIVRKVTLACNNFSLMNYQLKDTSVIDANATPPTIGKREESTHKVGICSFKDQN
jgi:hypothetical protein